MVRSKKIHKKNHKDFLRRRKLVFECITYIPDVIVDDSLGHRKDGKLYKPI